MPKENRIYLSPPHITGNEIYYINQAFDQNWVAPLGPNVDAFEIELAKYCGIKYSAALSSGTAALHLSLILLGVQPGDEVIASSFTFSATINPIIYQCAVPVLIDSEPYTWNMDPTLLEKAIKDRLSKGKKPKAIILVHLYGMPANMTDIMTIANHYEIPVIEDAAEALGSRFMNKQVGTFGLMAVISFNGNKIITTSGGGALLSNDQELVQKARFYATQARDNAPHYQHSKVGYNYRLSNILAGIGRGQLEAVEEKISKRRENFEFYYQHLKDYKGISFLQEPDNKYFSNRWLTTILLDPSKTYITRKYLSDALEMQNIESRPLWKPMHIQPVFAKYPAYTSGCSELLFEHGLCLPSGSGLTNNERNRIMKVFKKCFKHVH